MYEEINYSIQALYLWGIETYVVPLSLITLGVSCAARLKLRLKSNTNDWTYWLTSPVGGWPGWARNIYETPTAGILKTEKVDPATYLARGATSAQTRMKYPVPSAIRES